jgi:SAM-dependent methyltransferase
MATTPDDPGIPHGPGIPHDPGKPDDPGTTNNPVPRDWYRQWFDSPYYHKLYFERDEKEASAFIERLLSSLQLRPGSRLLDVACGRGRHSRILAEHDYDVTGIDLAPGSIAYARRFENKNLHFFVHDMRRLFYTHYFDAAFNLFTSFGYFATEREHRIAIRNICLSLTGNGILVLDYLNVNYVEDRLIHRSAREIDGVTYRLTKWSDKTHFYKKVTVEDRQLPEPLEFTEKVAKFTLNDFAVFFSREGWRIREVYGSYALENYDSRRSPRLLMIAEAAAANGR